MANAEFQPISLSRVLGMNSYDDSTTLNKDVLRLVQNMLPFKGSLQTREGKTKYNTTVLPSSSGVFGLGSYVTTNGENLLLAVSNGRLYSGSGGTFTERYSGLSASNLTSIVQFDDKAIVCDQVNKPIVYQHGATVVNLGIDSPKEYQIIENFESAAAWTVSNGTAVDNKVNHIYGNQCVQFTTNTGASMTCSKSLYATLNLTQFPSGTSSGTSDYISLFLIRSSAAAFANCHLDLGDATFTNYYSINLASLAIWTGNPAPNVALEIKVRKSSFTATGSPSWSSIAAVRFRIGANAGYQASVIVDFLRLEKTGPVPAQGSSGNLTGTYWYRVTYYTSDGWESDPSIMSDSITVNARQITLSNIPVSNSTRIASKRIYRIGGTSAEWRLVAILYDRSATTYTDNLPDTSLGDLYAPVEGYPYIPKCIAVHGNVVILANLTDYDGTGYPCGVMVSKENSIDIYDHLDFFQIEPNEGEEIKWIVSALDMLYVAKSNSIWKFDPDNLDIPPRNVSRIFGGAGPFAVCAGENEFYFFSPKVGVVSYNGSFFEIVSENAQFGSSVKNYIEAVPPDYIGKVWMVYFDNMVLLGLPQEGDTYPTVVLAYDTRRRFWSVFTGWDANCAISYNFEGDSYLYLGSPTSGYVHRAFSGDTDDGTDITSVMQTGDGDFGVPHSRKDFAKLFLFANKLTSEDVTLTLEPYYNTQDSGQDLTVTLTSAIHDALEIPFPSFGGYAQYLGLKITANKRWNFRSFVGYVRLLKPTV